MRGSRVEPLRRLGGVPVQRRHKYEPRDTAERSAIEQFESLEAAYIQRWKANLRRAASKRIRLVEIPRASHHIFLSHEADVV